jgi:hypothetical protein
MPSSGHDGRSGSVRARLLAVLADLGLVLDGSFTYPLTVEIRDARGATVSFRVDGEADLRPGTAGVTPTQAQILRAAPATAAEGVSRKKLARLAGLTYGSAFHGHVRRLIDLELLRETSDERVYRAPTAPPTGE